MICVTDNEFRANLLLRKIEAKKLPVESVKLEIGTRRSKLTKILGADPTMSPGRSNAEPVTSPNRTPSEAIDDFKKFFGLDKSKEGSSPKHSPKESPKISPNETRPVFKKSNKTRSIFFGERPPDELIVDQLEQFFPNINSDDLALPKQNIQLKNIVAENIKKKRDSKRMSSVMLRRQSGVRVTSLESKRITPVIPEDEAAEATEVETSVTPPQIVTPASVAPVIRWTPGQLIGQGAFGKVFHALNLDTGDFMAVKQVIGGDDSQQKKSFDSLKREIELLRELTHDNIVQYLGKVD